MAVRATDVLSTEREVARVSVLRTWTRRLGLVTESTPAVIGAGIIFFWIAAALLAPAIAPYPPNATSLAALAHPTPSAAHWLGTDQLGRDILSRILWGARTVLLIAPPAVLGAAILGSLLGLTAGHYRGVIDHRAGVAHALVPGIISTIILAHVGPAWNIIAVLTVTKAPIISASCAVSRSSCGAGVRRRRRCGASRRLHHACEILPNARGP
jgi:peptide/nickel transport system permease protein